MSNKIDPSTIKWDSEPKINPSTIQWDTLQTQSVAPEWAGQHPNLYGVTGAGKEVAQTLGSVVTNLPSDVYNIGKGTVNALIHPVETAKGIGNVALGGAEKLIPGQQGSEPAFNAMVDYFKNKYGSSEAIQNTLANHPAEVLLDLSTIFSGGGALAAKAGEVSKIGTLAKIGEAAKQAGSVVEPLGMAAKAAKGAVTSTGRLAGETVGITTGTGYGAVKQALKGGEEFTSAMRNGISGEDILKSTRDAFQTIKNERATGYRNELEKIAQIKGNLDVTPIKAKLDNLLEAYRIKTKTDGTLDFRHATLSPTEANAIQANVDLVRSWGSKEGDLTPLGLDSLKQQLGNTYSQNSKTSAFISQLENSVKDTLVKNVPNYEKMTANYSNLTKDINEVNKALSLGTRAGADTAIRKLTSILRDNNEYRKGLIQKLEEASGKDLQGQIAGLAFNSYMPRGLTGRIITGVEALSALEAFHPQFFGILTLGSPRLVGEFLNVLGKGAKVAKPVQKAITKIAPAGVRETVAQAGWINNIGATE